LQGKKGQVSSISRAINKARFAGRHATAPLRPLPDFVIIGAQRSGTTSLLRWLAAGPKVEPPLKKEVHYFDNHYDHGLWWYRAHFAIRGTGQLSGESTPYLLLHPLAPQRAAHDLPHTRFIALLRDPVERAISNYWHRRHFGVGTDESLEQALDRELERMPALSARVSRGETSLEHMAYAFVARGEYAPQLQRWFDAVGRDRVLVLETERLSRDPSEAQKVLDWLGLPPWDVPFPVINSAPRHEPASPEAVARLRAHFKPFNQQLFELLGYQLWTDVAMGTTDDRPDTQPPTESRLR
jgi:sulfotransferase family protein